MPAAHILIATSPDVRLVRHWDIDPHRELRYADDEEYAEHLRELFGRAIGARLRGLDRAAVLLSGGMDSSSIVAMAARLNPGGRPVDVRAYNHALREFPDADEERYAERVARHCGVPFVPIPFQRADLDHHLDNARRLEDTIPGTLGRSDDTLASSMTGDGCRVVLSGMGGDEWFTGAYQHSADLFRSGRFVAGARQLWADGHHPDAYHGVGVFAKTCLWALAPGPVRRAVKHVLPKRDLVPAGFNRAFARDVSLVERIAQRPIDRRFPTLAAAVIYRAAMHPDGVYFWDESARQASLFGHELSAPFLDRRLAEFAMAIPEEQRWSGRDNKRVLRAAMAGLLPDDIRMRQEKADPGAAMFAELEHLHRQGAFARMELAEAGVLDAAVIGSMYQEMVRLFADGQVHYKILSYRLWTFLAGEFAWRALFGRKARLPRGGFSGREAPHARFG